MNDNTANQQEADFDGTLPKSPPKMKCPNESVNLLAWKPALAELSRNPLIVAVVGFLLTGLLGTYLAWWLNSLSHSHDVEASTRNNALASVSDISDLVNERRERAALVISAIRRGAPQGETDARKTAYDEAYIRWNAKVPGDLLRVRAALHSAYRSSYERYIDGLTNENMLLRGTDATILLHGQQLPSRPGLFAIMDSCLTQAYDAYRANSYTLSDQISRIVASCKFSEVYSKLIFCFSTVSESLYSAISGIDGLPAQPISDEQVVDACKPP